MEYYKRDQKHAFITLVKRGLSEGKNRKSSNGPILAKLNALLAAHYIAEGLALPASEKRKTAEYLEEATGCLNEAEKRNTTQPEEVSIRKGKKVLVSVYRILTIHLVYISCLCTCYYLYTIL